MKCLTRLPLAAACGLVLALCLPALAQAATLNVPSQYGTIQSGVNAASNGDTVLIADGTYTGSGSVDIDFTSGMTHGLWDNSDGRLSLRNYALSGTFGQTTYGPYPGWAAIAVSAP